MNFSQQTALSKRAKSDLLVIPFFQEKKKAKCAAKSIGALQTFTKGPIELEDFKGKKEDISLVYMTGQPEKRLALLGLGDAKELTIEDLRRAYSSLAKTCQKLKVKHANFVMPISKKLTEREVARGIAEGTLLSNYAFDKLKHKTAKESPTTLLTKVTLVEAGKEAVDEAKKALGISQGVYFARDLVNENADDMTPAHIADVAKDLAKKFKNIKTTVLGKEQIEKEKMGLLLAVSRGSHVDPAFIISSYQGDPKGKESTVIVGKGVTYDTGGLNLKPTGFMETMKADMGGAATALGTLCAVATLGLPINLTVVIPSTENSIGSKSYKPGDVYKSYEGKTVEIGNTDAEGRLILADALAYSCKNLKPTRIIDFATLTGAIVIGLGEEVMGLMSNNQKLADQLLKAGHDSYERACQLPIYEEYRDQLKSKIADLSNVGGRSGGSITAALFLEEFVDKKIPWAHFDIAGTAFLKKSRRYHPEHATGSGVRLMLSFLESLAKK